MCGIAGIVGRQPVAGLATILEGFSRGLRHRGPDGVGFLAWAPGHPVTPVADAAGLADAPVGLMHRRLSIIDLSPAGAQPAVSADGRWVLVYNGELYNHVELRAGLEAAGDRFHTQSDTEVLLALLSRRGLDGLAEAIGMFAFALLDTRERRLTLARDLFGIKPLYVTTGSGTLAFASEIRPLLDLPWVGRAADATALYRYLRHGITDVGESTLFAGVRQLPPGHALEIDLDRPDQGRLRPLPGPPDLEELPGAAAVERLRALFLDSVRLHLRSDAPVSATLSGGVDSAGIVTAISALREPGAAPLRVFSYMAEAGTRADEARWTECSARAAGADLVPVRLSPEALADELDDLIATQEQPFGSTSIWAQRHVFRTVREEGYKVVLDGQGADELFGGYEVFRAARLADLLAGGRVGRAARLLAALPAHQRRATVMLAGSYMLPDGLNQALRRATGQPLVPDDVDPGWLARHGIDPRALAPSKVAMPYLPSALGSATTQTSLPMLLRYADRNAMSVSLENRVPFLSPTLATAARSLPADLLVSPEGVCKAGLRAALRGLVPDPVLDRGDKIGFETPERQWFQSVPALRDLLGRIAAKPAAPCFRTGHHARRRAVAEGSAPLEPAMWRSLNLTRWAELFRVELPE